MSICPSGRDHAPCHLDKGPTEAERSKEAARQSDQLTDELLESDLLVISTPIWNFGIPSHLKAWIDLVVRPGRTFQYSDGGVLGLAKDKKAILVLASGGVFTEGPWRPWDFAEPYLRQILGFIGIVDVQPFESRGLARNLRNKRKDQRRCEPLQFFSMPDETEPIALALSGNNLFVPNHNNTVFDEYNASTERLIKADFITGLSGAVGLAVTPVPEPSTWSMIAVGGVVLLGIMLRKKHRIA